MQKSVAILAVFYALVLAARVEAFAVYLDRIILGTTNENGGVPEIFLVCDVGEPQLLEVDLSNVDEVGVEYVANPPIYIDRDLGPNEEHTCYIVEADSIFPDPDREDDEDDVYGSFTVSRSSFADETVITLRHVDDTVAFRLGCEQC